jgi:hypothetical protein
MNSVVCGQINFGDAGRRLQAYSTTAVRRPRVEVLDPAPVEQ